MTINSQIISNNGWKKPMVYATFLVSLTVILFVLNLIIGSVYIPIDQLIHSLSQTVNSQDPTALILLKSRLPQALTAILAGAGLAVSGLLLQTLFRNPLADPSILGISAGAGLGVAITLMLSGFLGNALHDLPGVIGNLTITLSSFLGAFVVLLIVLNLSFRIQNNAVLLIIGLMISYAAGACIDLLKFFSQKEDIYVYVMWGMGSFSNTSSGELSFMAPIVTIALGISLLLIKPLNILLLGTQYSTNLGLNLKSIRLIILLVTGLLAAVITAFCGPIAFIGLAVPHLVKGVVKTSNHAILIPSVIFGGASLALICNLIAKMPGFDGTLPINSVTSFIGAPVVIWVLLSKKNEKRF